MCDIHICRPRSGSKTVRERERGKKRASDSKREVSCAYEIDVAQCGLEIETTSIAGSLQ